MMRFNFYYQNKCFVKKVRIKIKTFNKNIKETYTLENFKTKKKALINKNNLMANLRKTIFS